jgi:hypothetical protein
MDRLTKGYRQGLTILELTISLSTISLIMIITMSVFRTLALNSAHVASETALSLTMNNVSGTIEREMRHALATTVGFDLSTNDTPVSFREVQFRKVVRLSDQGRPIIGDTAKFWVDEKGDFHFSRDGFTSTIGSFGATGNTNDTAGLVFLPITVDHDVIEFTVRVTGVNRANGESQTLEKRVRMNLFNKIDLKDGTVPVN